MKTKALGIHIILQPFGIGIAANKVGGVFRTLAAKSLDLTPLAAKLGGNMKKWIVLMALVLLPALAQANTVTVKVYSGFVGAGGGAPYSGFVGSFNSPDINFANPFLPFGQVNFGADLTGSLNVASTGTYVFNLLSDDGSLLFIDGGLVVNDGGVHPPAGASGSVSLTAGVHSFEVQYFECCSLPAQLQLALPGGVSYVPEPGVLTLLGSTGLLAIVGSFRRKFARL
jgi:hypothetical protein